MSSVWWCWKRLCPWVIVVCLFVFAYDLISSSQQPILRSHLTYLDWAAARQEMPSRQHQQHRSFKGSSSRVALCLVGGARAFEFTGPSINRHVISNKSNVDVDVFVHAPLDKDAFKLFLLRNTSGVNFAAARIFRPQHVEEHEHYKQVLTGAGSPQGIQGLLQYFNLVEGCWNLVTKHEEQQNFRYDWILRTRLDGFWNGPLPPLETLDRSSYTVPQGSHFGGLNDRFGIGNRETSMVALRRLTSLDSLHRNDYQNLNSETAFKAQLDSSNTTFKLRNLPFCVLTSRKYDWPPGEWGVPVMALSSKGPLNGAKCKPCIPKVVGDPAKAMVQVLNKGWGWTEPSGGLELCDSRTDWDSNWQSVFDKDAGEEARVARTQIARITRPECISKLREFARLWMTWDAPSSEEICAERTW